MLVWVVTDISGKLGISPWSRHVGARGIFGLVLTHTIPRSPNKEDIFHNMVDSMSNMWNQKNAVPRKVNLQKSFFISQTCTKKCNLRDSGLTNGNLHRFSVIYARGGNLQF